jgi:NAD-specific glutamate dehydrogenase
VTNRSSVEGTADMMDWAALHARDRGAETWWKSFTTGKSAKHLGGIPHDTYGMTSLSIRQYVLGIYKQLGLREKDITKVQTGGPGKLHIYSLGLIFDTVLQMEISVQVSCHKQ